MGGSWPPPALTCCANYVYGWNPSYVNVNINGNVFANILSTNSCTNNQEDISEDFDDWWSNNPPTAGVVTQHVTGVAPGFTTANASGEIWEGVGTNCSNVPVHATASVAVQVPDHMYVLTDVQNTLNCSPNPNSREREITYSVVDGTNAPMQIPFLLKENVPTNITSSCNGKVVQTGAICTSNLSYLPGQLAKFTDFLAPGCPSSPQNSPCGFQFAKQQWQWCPGVGQPTSIGTIGADNVENTIINVDGNITGFVPGTTFPR